jgi:hypothetical protein
MPYTQAIFRSKSQPPEHHHGIRGIPGIWTAALSGIARARFCRTPPTSPAVQLTADDEFGNLDCDAGLSFRHAASIAAPAAACHALPSGPGRSVRQRPRRPRAGDAWDAAMAAPRDTRRQFPVEASEPAEGDSGQSGPISIATTGRAPSTGRACRHRKPGAQSSTISAAFLVLPHDASVRPNAMVSRMRTSFDSLNLPTVAAALSDTDIASVGHCMVPGAPSDHTAAIQ